MNTYGKQVDEAAGEALSHGYIVHRSTPNALLIDLDDGKQLVRAAFPLLQEQFNAKVEAVYTSRNGKGSHVIISLNTDLPLLERAAYQAALGDDPKRVILAIWNHLDRGIAEPFLLFQPRTK